MNKPKRLLSINQVAELFSVSRWTVRHWINDGMLEIHVIGAKCTRITEESVLRLQERTRITDGRVISVVESAA
jgi:excisionase family DNA binding protein